MHIHTMPACTEPLQRRAYQPACPVPSYGGAHEIRVCAAPSQGRAYKAVVYIFLDGGADTYNILVPTDGCTGGEGTDLWAQWAAARGDNVLAKSTLLSITADIATQPCRCTLLSRLRIL